MFQHASNTRQQGDVGLAAAIAYFGRSGFTVSIPLTDSQHYDLIVDNGTQLLRVQVKTTSHRGHSGAYVAQLKTNGGNRSWSGVAKFFDPSIVELLFVLCENGAEYCIPTSAIRCRSAITLGKKYAQFQMERVGIEPIGGHSA